MGKINTDEKNNINRQLPYVTEISSKLHKD